MKIFQKAAVLLGVMCSMSIAVCGCSDVERTVNKWLTSTDSLESQALELIKGYLHDVKMKNPGLSGLTVDKFYLSKKGDSYEGTLYLTGPQGKKVQAEIEVEFDGKYIECSFEQLNEELNKLL